MPIIASLPPKVTGWEKTRYKLIKPDAYALARKTRTSKIELAELNHLVVYLMENPNKIPTMDYSSRSINIFESVLRGEYPENMKATARYGLELVAKVLEENGIQGDTERAKAILKSLDQELQLVIPKPAPNPITPPLRLESVSIAPAAKASPSLVPSTAPKPAPAPMAAPKAVVPTPAAKPAPVPMAPPAPKPDPLEPIRTFYLERIKLGELYSLSVAFLKLFQKEPLVREILQRNSDRKDHEPVGNVSGNEVDRLVAAFNTLYSTSNLRFQFVSLAFFPGFPDEAIARADDDNFKHPHMGFLFIVTKTGAPIGELGPGIYGYPKQAE